MELQSVGQSVGGLVGRGSSWDKNRKLAEQ